MKRKYSLLKLVFIGKKPLDRKHKPNILEYIHLLFGNFLSISLILIFSVDLINGHSITYTFNGFLNKIVLAFFIGNILVMLATSSRLYMIQNKTEEFKLVYVFAILFSLLIITAPVAITFCILGWKYNIIEFI